MKKSVTSLWPQRFAAVAHYGDERVEKSGEMNDWRNGVIESDLFPSRGG